MSSINANNTAPYRAARIPQLGFNDNEVHAILPIGTVLTVQTNTGTVPSAIPAQTIFVTPTLQPTSGTADSAYGQTVRDCLTEKSYDCFIAEVEATLSEDGSVNIGALKALKAALELESVPASQSNYSKAHPDMSIIVNDLLLISEKPDRYDDGTLIRIGGRTQQSLLQLAETCATSNAGGGSTLIDADELKGVYKAQAKVLISRFHGHAVPSKRNVNR